MLETSEILVKAFSVNLVCGCVSLLPLLPLLICQGRLEGKPGTPGSGNGVQSLTLPAGLRVTTSACGVNPSLLSHHQKGWDHLGMG